MSILASEFVYFDLVNYELVGSEILVV